MQREEEIRAILASILRTGLLRIRHWGIDGHATRCSLEADHLHNLPEIITKPAAENLLYYINVEKPAFIKKAFGFEQFESDWNRLQVIIDEICQQTKN
jgi:hypothetical protein